MTINDLLRTLATNSLFIINEIILMLRKLQISKFQNPILWNLEFSY
ncbi:hypothetical protein FEM08_22230 [Flavobacterium gilvum]|nr:hypothetical protein FEM08_22230 [Flavobacterium gilvum]